MRISAIRRTTFIFFLFSSAFSLQAQKGKSPNALVYVDKEGVLRWTKNNGEASFFGVNYTVPFAYSYRAHKALGVDPETAIREDVYHLARLGLDAFRVHVWDTEISDSLGNLLENEHLRLFDFLVAELKKRNIRIIITPIAFWGNGYPQRDEHTPGFSRVFGKGRATVNDTAIRAQENYLRQFFKHVNIYTQLTYGDDPNVIAVELNNEPSHSGPKSGVTEYINRLAAAVRSDGWAKPLYYNISQSPYYADAVAKANINGVSFQWYPTGLVGGAILRGNYIPNVDRYVVPFDTIPAFRNKSRMVYEFDAADVLQSNMYPAMARSFRTAGFQWATQFAYDPMALAYANTEYQTHYLSLPYTPSKAISLMIASAVFHRIPRGKSFGAYPADSVFDSFRVSYKEGLSEMNTADKFYYSNTTGTRPMNPAALTNIAGVGSSPVVHYPGTGAYFLDKVAGGVWRLEVMPDVIYIRDPFAKASPGKEVTRVEWQTNVMKVALPDLGPDFTIEGLNEGNDYSAVTGAEGFPVNPGTYLLVSKGRKLPAGMTNIGAIGLHEFVAPRPFSNGMFLHHEPYAEVTTGKAFTIVARVAGIDTGRVTLQISRLGEERPVMIPMLRRSAIEFTAEVPAEMVRPGELDYRIIMQKGEEAVVFPGERKGNPFAWDNYYNDTWKTLVATEDGGLEIFNPTTDRTAQVYPAFRRGFQSGYITGEDPGRLFLKLSSAGSSKDPMIGFQYSFAGKLEGRMAEATSFDRLLIRARTAGATPVKVKITLTDLNAFSWAAYITLDSVLRNIEVPLQELAPDSSWVMPRPYPGFQPTWFKAMGTAPAFRLSDMEKIQVTLDPGSSPGGSGGAYSLEVGSIWFQKSR